ncbi:MAG: TetR/AcrR family transcriptional regulator [Clostridiales bacterium]|nr:TetR/AcrR family transcriptional regulator [Clostridiales bacterium]
MPRSFSESEKTYIRELLMQEAETCLALYGIRKTTVDELVRRVKIPKGTFYLFYESKEALIFDVILKYNTEIQDKLIGQISGMRKKPDAEKLTDIVFCLYKSLDGSFLLKLVENGELELLMRKAPPGFVQANTLDDEMMVDKLMALFPGTDKAKSALFSAALRGAFLLLLHKKEIAYDRFDDMLRVIVRGVIIQMFGE